MKVGIVGSGFVGATAGYALVMRGIGREVVLVDKDRARADAEADDIRHAVPFSNPLEVRGGGPEDLAGCKVVVICAGVGQKPGESRLQLLQRNAGVFRDIVPTILSTSPNAVIVVATNPVDVMTHVTCKFAAEFGIAAGRVLGTGTTLDTARFRTLLGGHCKVDPHHVHAYVLGEHGDSEVLTWSLATVGGMRIDEFARRRGVEVSEQVRNAIDRDVRGAAERIIRGKRATYYGIGAAIARVVEAILHDQKSILTVCAPTPEVAGVQNVTLSLPRLVGGNGVADTFSLPISPAENELLRTSAQIIRNAIDELEQGA